MHVKIIYKKVIIIFINTVHSCVITSNLADNYTYESQFIWFIIFRILVAKSIPDSNYLFIKVNKTWAAETWSEFGKIPSIRCHDRNNEMKRLVSHLHHDRIQFAEYVSSVPWDRSSSQSRGDRFDRTEWQSAGGQREVLARATILSRA